MNHQGAWISLATGLSAGVAASACCAGALVLLVVDPAGIWVDRLTALEAYRPIFMLVAGSSFVLLASQLFRPMERCKPDCVCGNPYFRARYRKLFWTFSSIALIAISSPHWIPALAI